jgi:hypothetical protein
MNIDSSAKTQVATSSSHNRIVSVLDKLPNGCIKSTIERRSHDFDHAGNIHSKRNLASPHAVYLRFGARVDFGLLTECRSPGVSLCGEASCNRPSGKSQTEGGLLLGAAIRRLNHSIPAVSAAFL